MNKYLVIPDCSDLNRGDQALIWETIRIAKDAGFNGEYYMQYSGKDCSQSIADGVKVFNPVLEHPSRKKSKDNVNYRTVLLSWGITALCDFIRSLWVLLICRSRRLCCLFLSKRSREMVELLRETKGVFVKGGGFIHSFGGPTAFYFIYYHLFSINLANRMGVPVYVMPNSFGPIDGFLCKWQVRQALKKCKLIYCREHVSYEYMTKYFPEIGFQESFDFGLYLQSERRVLDIKKPADKEIVAITVRPYRFPEHSNGDELYRQYITSMTAFVNWLIDNGYYPMLIQHTLAHNAHEDDMKAIQDIEAGLTSERYGVFSDISYNCRNMKFLYSHFDYIVGTRFHSVIFSMMEGLPALAIAYGGNKTRGIMKDLGLDEYVVGIDEISKECMIDKFTLLVKNKVSVKSKLAVAKTRVNMERDKIVEQLKTINCQL